MKESKILSVLHGILHSEGVLDEARVQAVFFFGKHVLNGFPALPFLLRKRSPVLVSKELRKIMLEETKSQRLDLIASGPKGHARVMVASATVPLLVNLDEIHPGLGPLVSWVMGKRLREIDLLGVVGMFSYKGESKEEVFEKTREFFKVPKVALEWAYMEVKALPFKCLAPAVCSVLRFPLEEGEQDIFDREP